MRVPASSIEFVERLVEAIPELKSLHSMHIREYEELLPHVFFGDVSRYVIECLETSAGTAPDAIVQLLNFLEAGLTSANEEIKELISVSFLENIFEYVRIDRVPLRLLGPTLRSELERFGPLKS